MATAARSFSRAIPRATFTSSLRSAAPRTSLAKPQLSQTIRRTYASGTGSSSSTSRTPLYIGAGLLAAAGAGAYFYLNQKDVSVKDVHLTKGSAGETPGVFKPTKEDYQKVYNQIAHLLVERDEYDDGSYGPVLVRLAWHCSGTYDAATGTGGSNGATMRFTPEGDHGANAGLKHARDFLEPVKRKPVLTSHSPGND